eukprot:TRINITY_DN12652_c0_g1_i6.p2 TRINITY_DN12652_c0_g1~~TRINITY_DN12652_c0_g1_i6.p2  ORF type:complete len:197 (+),score=33.38 TRINITY_DN12652_c0_g1_i6:489-1079(+)
MSRIGNSPIVIPSGVDIKINGNTFFAKGSLGELSYDFYDKLQVKKEDNGTIVVSRPNDEKEIKSLHGLTRTLLNNMVVGVSKGYEKVLSIIGTGYNASRVGKWLKISVGYSHDILIEVPTSIQVEVENVPRSKDSKLNVVANVVIKGISKEEIGKFAAEIRKIRPPENYKGKGIRYQDEKVLIKESSKAKKQQDQL